MTFHQAPFAGSASPFTLPLLKPLGWLVDSLRSAFDEPPPAAQCAPATNNEMRYVVYGYSENGSPIGAPEPSSIAGFNVFNMAFKTSGGSEGLVPKWIKASQQQRDDLKGRYRKAGIKLVLSVGGADDKTVSKGLNAGDYARKIAAFAKKYSFDGVDFDYEEFDIFGQKRVLTWLVDFTNTLRGELGCDAIVTHAPIAPWFSTKDYPSGSYVELHKRAGDSINWYNIQYYNQGRDAYTRCDDLIWNSTPSGYQSTSIFEIAKYGKIPKSKLVIGKPGAPDRASNGYVAMPDLGKCVGEAVANGWKAGVMFWEFPAMYPGKLTKMKGSANLLASNNATESVAA